MIFTYLKVIYGGPKMKTLDLHGVKHHEVDRLVENFIH